MGLRLVRAACIAALLPAGLFASVGSAQPSGAAAVTAARLHITITTTSSWTQVRISPGYLAATRVVSHSRDGRFSSSRQSLGLTGVVSRGTVTADVVLAELTGAPSMKVEVDKGVLGSTEVSIRNTNAEPYDVAVLTDNRQDVTDPDRSITTSVARDRMMSTAPLWLPKVDEGRLVLAAYYPWFSGYTKQTLADTPARPRSVWSAAGVKSMTRQAKANGINGFVVSWHGNDSDGPAFDLVRRAAEATEQVFTAYLEVPSAHQAGRAQSATFKVRRWLLQALTRRSSPAFLRASDGAPVVFVYGMAHLTPSEWRDVLARVANRQGVHVHLVGDTLKPAYRPYEWGVHRYAVLESARRLTTWSRSAELSARAQTALDPTVRPTLYAGTASPGFNDRRLRGDVNPVIRRGSQGHRYDATWTAALAGEPDWMFVSTWNEWYEDTQVEPGTRTGARALSQTARHAAAWRG